MKTKEKGIEKLYAIVRENKVTVHGYIEDGKPLIIFPYEKANYGCVNYVTVTGHGEADLNNLMESTKYIKPTDQEKIAEAFELLGYGKEYRDGKIEVIYKASRDRVRKENWEKFNQL